jgi:hypothetical protein
MVVFDSTSTYSNSTDDLALIVPQRDSSRKSDESTIGVFDIVKRTTGLRKPTDVASIHVEHPRCTGFLDRDVDATKPRSVHSQEGSQVRTRVDYSDIQPRVELLGLPDRSG